MKNSICLLVIGLMLTGCSKSEEMTDKAASNLVSRIQSPIDQARAVSAKAAATREADVQK
ncbi:MAG: hypothetical protein PHP93_02750 [Kiritimatiellales bacterium]|nr:hypothetical protein [Kiritimatiellales bacterium]